MAEDFNDGPIVIEDKQSILSNKENCSLCGNNIGLIECGNCGLRFCNEIHNNQSDIIFHINNSEHNSIKIITNNTCPNTFEELKCCVCKDNNIFNLYILINENQNCFETNKVIFCKNHAPKNKDIQPIVEKKGKTNDNLILNKDNKSKTFYQKIDEKKIYER